MQAVFEDLYDREGLKLRFVPRESCSHDSAKALSEFIPAWMQQQAELCPADWERAELFSVTIESDLSVVALFDLPPEYMCKQLADAAGREFSDYSELRVGDPIQPCSTAAVDDLHQLPGGTVATPLGEVRIAPVAVSKGFVSAREYERFIKETGYRPIPDRREEFSGYVLETSVETWGPKGPVFQVTLRDAEAYCRWANCRLPTASELLHFFQVTEAAGVRQDWAMECWSSTYLGREKYATIASGSEVNALHRDHYEWVEAPSFRIASSADTIS